MNARRLLAVVSAAAVCGVAAASPGLDVRSVGAGPVTPGNGPAGPAADPTTQNGQWFLMNNGVADFRTHEFHDNISGAGGGPIDHLAISGTFAGYQTSGGFITGYQMNVRITNNTPQVSGPIASQPNTHGESRAAPFSTYVGDMLNVRFTAHWADDGIPFNFQQGSANIGSANPGPSSTSPGTSNTFAVGQDGEAWYSYTQPIPGTIIGGSYQVPTWDFGNIAVGATASRILSFGFYQPVPIAQLPTATQLAGQDLLIARSDDIKIGCYFQDDPLVNGIRDQFAPSVPGSNNAAFAMYGNSSVFFTPVPAPGAGVVLALSGAVLTGRRRRN